MPIRARFARYFIPVLDALRALGGLPDLVRSATGLQNALKSRTSNETRKILAVGRSLTMMLHGCVYTSSAPVTSTRRAVGCGR